MYPLETGTRSEVRRNLTLRFSFAVGVIEPARAVCGNRFIQKQRQQYSKSRDVYFFSFFISFSFINDNCLCSIPFFSGEGQNKSENCTELDDFFEEQRADSFP